MERLTGLALLDRPEDLVLWRSGRDYYAGGRKLARISGGSWAEAPKAQVLHPELFRLLSGRRRGSRPSWVRRHPDETTELLAKANALRLTQLEEEAIWFLRAVRSHYAGLPLVVSWSGGKDSTAVSGLAFRAFPNQRIAHVFADTTIELPSTYQYFAEYRAARREIPFLVGVPARDFVDMCRELGPPSRIQRWCCATHKAAPLSNALAVIAGPGPVLCVTGLRHEESPRRQAYGRLAYETKVGQQMQLNPIIGWSEYDVWSWTIANRAPLNEGYRFGLDRIGCAFCPLSSVLTENIIRVVWPPHYAEWRDVLRAFAEELGLGDAEEYIRAREWRHRVGGRIRGRELAGAEAAYDIRSERCEDDNLVVNYQTTQRVRKEPLAQLLKVFGRVIVEGSQGQFTLLSVEGRWGSLYLQVFADANLIRVRFASARQLNDLQGTLRAHLRKLQACVGCGACAALCPRAAIIRVGPDFTIAEGRCTGCLRCVRNLKAGCVAADALHASKVGLSVG